MTITLLIKKHACKSEKIHDSSILWNPSGFAQGSAGIARIRSRTAPLQRNQQCLMQNAPVQSRTWPDVHIENTLITLPKAIKTNMTLLIRWLQVLKNKQTKALKRTGEKHFWEDIKSIWHFSDYLYCRFEREGLVSQQLMVSNPFHTDFTENISEECYSVQ